jgi:hypothetical protein
VVLMFLSLPVALGFLCYGFATKENGWFPISGMVVAAGLVFMTLNWMISGRVRCPLCMVPPLVNRSCSKHKTAAKFLGSHRLFVAQSVLLKDCFRCPYCGEYTAMQVRERSRR